MTDITKEELHKLIDGADIENLQKTYAEYSEKSSGMLIGNRLGAIVRYLKESQEPKELTLHEKLINAGFNYGPHCQFHSKGNIHVTIYPDNVFIEVFIIVRLTSMTIHSADNQNNHDKVFEAIDFLTKWQS